MKESILYCALCCLLLVGCSTAKTKVDRGPIKAGTFSFIRTRSAPEPASANETAVHTMVQDAITHALADKGVKKLPTGGDVTVAYLIIGGNNAATTSLNEYYGYGGDAQALVDEVHKAQTIKSDRRDYFEAGTLVIDLIDPHENRLLWRSSMQRDILRNLAPEVRAARLQQVVDASLKDLRISP